MGCVVLLPTNERHVWRFAWIYLSGSGRAMEVSVFGACDLNLSIRLKPRQHRTSICFKVRQDLLTVIGLLLLTIIRQDGLRSIIANERETCLTLLFPIRFLTQDRVVRPSALPEASIPPARICKARPSPRRHHLDPGGQPAIHPSIHPSINQSSRNKLERVCIVVLCWPDCWRQRGSDRDVEWKKFKMSDYESGIIRPFERSERRLDGPSGRLVSSMSIKGPAL